MKWIVRKWQTNLSRCFIKMHKLSISLVHFEVALARINFPLLGSLQRLTSRPSNMIFIFHTLNGNNIASFLIEGVKWQFSTFMISVASVVSYLSSHNKFLGKSQNRTVAKGRVVSKYSKLCKKVLRWERRKINEKAEKKTLHLLSCR